MRGFWIIVALAVIASALYCAAEESQSEVSSSRKSSDDATGHEHEQYCSADGVCEGEDQDAASLYPHGHLRPLGSHQEPEPELEEYPYFLPPEMFRDNHVQPSSPAIFRQVLSAESTDVFLDDARLGEAFGHLEIGVEQMKKEKRGGPATLMKIQDFLQQYNTSELYFADGMPMEMKTRWTIPAMLLCCEIPEKISQVNVWFSSGGTSSVLHVDNFENLHCLVDGVKNMVLIHKDDRDRIGMDRLTDGSFTMDVDRVDMTQFNVEGVAWWNVTLEAGDCIFIPELWLHQVRSYGRNFAVNVWWKDVPNADRSTCDAVASEFDCHDGNPYNCDRGIPASEIKLQEHTNYVADVLARVADADGRVTMEIFSATMPEMFPQITPGIANELFTSIFDKQGRGFIVPKEDITPETAEASARALEKLLPGQEPTNMAAGESEWTDASMGTEELDTTHASMATDNVEKLPVALPQ